MAGEALADGSFQSTAVLTKHYIGYATEYNSQIIQKNLEPPRTQLKKLILKVEELSFLIN